MLKPIVKCDGCNQDIVEGESIVMVSFGGLYLEDKSTKFGMKLIPTKMVFQPNSGDRNKYYHEFCHINAENERR